MAPITNPLEIRDVIVKYFNDSHSAYAELACNDSELNQKYCTQIAVKAFMETGGDFDHPTKQSLQAALNWLIDFSKACQEQPPFLKRIDEIQKLIANLKE